MIAVIGAGISGMSVANHAVQRGEMVRIFDDMCSEKRAEELKSRLPPGVELVEGMLTKEMAHLFAYVVISPGVPVWKLPLSWLDKHNVEVIGEVEYAFRNLEGKIVAITGTNGKSTVTALTGLMMEKEKASVFTGGNLRVPLTHACDKQYEFYIVELSSFQLETIKHFRPDVGVLLNIGEDHMDRYPHFKEYCEAKGRLFENQEYDDSAIYNVSDLLTFSLANKSRGRKYGFSVREKLEEGAWLSGDRINIKVGSFKEEIGLSECKLEGMHNLENVAAASLAAVLAGAGPESIAGAISEFRGLPHRMEYAGTVGIVDYYNDSKATNVHALCSALRGIDRKIVLIAGGKDKGLSFEPALGLILEKVKCMILVGEAGPRIKEEVGENISCRMADSMDNAVFEAHEVAGPGDMVLFSPGCSSFDMFENFEKRGDAFKKAVMRLSKIEQKN